MGDSTFHSELSPSKRHRWAACPGSIREEAKYPPEAGSGGPAALDGTRTHALLEHAINFEFRDKLGTVDPNRYLGKNQDEHGEYTVDADRVWRLRMALDYIRSRVGGFAPIAEQRVYPDGFVGRADMSGTVDCQIPGTDVYEIIDYKDGMAPVEVENNPQLEMYALGALAAIPSDAYPKYIRMTVIQPKLAHRGMPPIASHDIAVPDLLARVPVIIAQAAATEDPNAPLVPGETQCKYCRAKGSCKALAGKVMQELNMSSLFGPIHAATTAFDGNVPGTTHPDLAYQSANKDPGKMDDAELRQILEAAPLVRQLLDGCEDEVKRRLESGRPVPGFKMVRGKGSRDWALPEEEMIKKLGPGGMGIPKSVLLPTKLLSVAQVEKASWTDKNGNTEKLTDRQLKRMENEYVTKRDGKPIVVLESDPRPAIVNDASSMFGAIDTSSAQNALKAIGVEVPAFLGGAPAPAIPSFLQAPAWLR